MKEVKSLFPLRQGEIDNFRKHFQEYLKKLPWRNWRKEGITLEKHLIIYVYIVSREDPTNYYITRV